MQLKEKYKIVETGGRTFALFANKDSEAGFIPFGINETGARLLELLGKGCDMQALLAALEAEYSVEQDVLRRDVEIYLDRLAQFGILED